MSTPCPTCNSPLTDELDECPACGQEFCPDCGTPLHTNAAACPTCGAEFDLFCPECEAPLQAGDAVCLSCGHVFPSPETRVVSALAANAVMAHAVEADEALRAEPFTGHCPACREPLYVEDGFCEACGATFCAHCGHLVDEDDEVCQQCGRALFFACPLCEADLTTGTPVCPHCHALFPAFCAFCQTALELDQETCAHCGRDNAISQRRPVRVLHTLLAGEQPVFIIACHACGTAYDPAESFCPTCQNAVCGNCLTALLAEEAYCPRCGRAADDKTPGRESKQTALLNCPACGRAITLGDDECPHCEQALCPACGKAISQQDTVCRHCGTEFDFSCPGCGERVDAAATTCPHCQTVLV